MKYIKCDRCGTELHITDNQADIKVTVNYLVPVNNFKNTVDLCEKCIKQFFTHFMNNHYFYKD